MAPVPPQSQKSVLAGLIAFGVLAIVLGAFNLKRLIGPLRAQPAVNVPSLPRTRAELEAQQAAALAALDTDRDGLDDLTELERTKTSPFLADSDSDGKTDKEEVDAGEDPNCPQGKVCGAELRPEGVVRPTVTLDLHGVPSIAAPTNAASATSAGTPSDLTPAELRRALERQGILRRALDQLTDAQLTASYGAMLESLTKLPTGEPSPFADALRGSFSDALLGNEGGGVGRALDALPSTPSAIREALLRGGFPREQLQKLDDATLLSMWKQTIDDLKKQQATSP